MASALFELMDVTQRARDLLAGRPWSKIGLRRELRASGAGEPEIRAAIDSLVAQGTDWQRECLRSAQSMCREQPACSRQDLRRQLGTEGFLPAEVEYAEKTMPVNWFDHARRAYAQMAQPGLDPVAALDLLRSGGFTSPETAYAFGVIPDAAEKQALLRAQYLLGSAPSSQQSIYGELAVDYANWIITSVMDELGDIWDGQAIKASWRLLGRYGPALSQQRLGSYLRVQNFTLQQIAGVYENLPVDWQMQALQCARYYYYRKGVPLEKIRDSVRQHKFTIGQAKSAVQALSST